MKKLIIITLILIESSQAFSQRLSKLFDSQEMVWCGLDFSMVRCIGPIGFADPRAIKEVHLNAWNNLVLAEAPKYNFKEAYQKTNVINDLSVVMRRNELPDYKTFVISEPYHFQKGDLKKIIADYTLEAHKEGLGLVYVYETLDKTAAHASVYAVFFDIATREIIWSNNYFVPANGFGFRNFWAKTVYETIKKNGEAFGIAKESYKIAMKANQKN